MHLIESNRKVALCALFSLGIFVMICAIVSKYYSFTSPFSTIWEWWYTREASIAICVVNIPHCWALWRRIFRLRSFIHGHTATGPTGEGEGIGDMSGQRSGTHGTLDIPLSRNAVPPSQTGIIRHTPLVKNGDIKVTRDIHIHAELIKTESVASSAETPRDRLELEIHQMEHGWQNSSTVTADRG